MKRYTKDLHPLVASLAQAEVDALRDALANREIDVSASAFVVRERLHLSSAASGVVSRLLRLASLATGDRDSARWLILGLTSTPPASVPPGLVWTSPLASPPTRDTSAVLRERIALARASIVIVGYALTAGAEAVLADLADAVSRHVRVWLVADRMEEKIPALVTHWPAGLPLPELWSRPPDLRDGQSALHAKVAIFDQEWLLLTSANLTYHGLRGNLEMGVLLHGVVAADAMNLVREWTGARLLVPVSI